MSQPVQLNVRIDADAVARRFGGLAQARLGAALARGFVGARSGIRPTRKRALTVPIGENLTGAGVARYPSVADLQAAFGAEQILRRGRTIGRFENDEWKAYFLLTGHVAGRDVLEPALTSAQPEMVATVQDAVDALMRD
jgi:hypothetical protein